MGDELAHETDDVILVRIVAPRFVAGIEFRGGVAVRWSPKLKRRKGWTLDEVLADAGRNGWKCEIL